MVVSTLRILQNQVEDTYRTRKTQKNAAQSRLWATRLKEELRRLTLFPREKALLHWFWTKKLVMEEC